MVYCITQGSKRRNVNKAVWEEILNRTGETESGPEFLRPLEVAELLRCGRSKAYEIMRSGSVRTYTVGRNKIVKRSDLIAWLDSHSADREHGSLR